MPKPYLTLYQNRALENIGKVLHTLGLPEHLAIVEDWKRSHFESAQEDSLFWTLKLEIFGQMSAGPTRG